MNRKSASIKTLAIVLAASMLSGNVLTSCNTVKNSNKTQRGAAIGAGSGAVIGGVIGRRSGNTAIGAIIGATVGGAAGAVIGRKMDKQAEELKRKLPNATVERVGEGIKITFNSDILFSVGKYDLRSATTEKDLADFAETLNQYSDTNVLIEGHADATGSEDLNLKLSKERAKTVADYLESKGVKSSRIDEKGYGESQPVASNDTESGRQQNRRVDIAVYANDKMIKAAQKGDLETR